MTKLKSLSLAAVAYAASIVIAQGSMCWAGLSKCTLGSNLTTNEIVGSALALLVIFFTIGVLVAWIYAATIYPLRRVKETWIRLVLFLVAGALIGMLPRLLWDLMWGVFAEPFSLASVISRFLPWSVAGVGCAIVIGRSVAARF